MSAIARFLTGDLVLCVVSRWLDKKIDKPLGFQRAKRVGAGLSFIRIGRYYEEQGDYNPWRRALAETLWHQRNGSLHHVNRFSYPANAFKSSWMSQAKS